jgi:hypothetical protein
MKNKAIEALIRANNNLADDVQVDVEFLASIGTEEEYRVDWYNDDTVFTQTLTVNARPIKSVKVGD